MEWGEGLLWGHRGWLHKVCWEENWHNIWTQEGANHILLGCLGGGGGGGADNQNPEAL